MEQRISSTIELSPLRVEPRYTSQNTLRDVDLGRLKFENRDLYRAFLKMRETALDIDVALTRCDIRDGMAKIADAVELATRIEQGAHRMGLDVVREEAQAVREYSGLVGERFHGRCRCDRR